LGAVPLTNAKVNANVKSEVKGASNLFEIETVIQKSWIVSAKTPEERDSWVQAIQ
jgi:hypothetical protein